VSRPIVGSDDSCDLVSIDCCAESYTLQWQWFAMTKASNFCTYITHTFYIDIEVRRWFLYVCDQYLGASTRECNLHCFPQEFHVVEEFTVLNIIITSFFPLHAWPFALANARGSLARYACMYILSKKACDLSASLLASWPNCRGTRSGCYT
jgi:hypothetical protein